MSNRRVRRPVTRQSSRLTGRVQEEGQFSQPTLQRVEELVTPRDSAQVEAQDAPQGEAQDAPQGEAQDPRQDEANDAPEGEAHVTQRKGRGRNHISTIPANPELRPAIRPTPDPNPNFLVAGLGDSNGPVRDLSGLSKSLQEGWTAYSEWDKKYKEKLLEQFLLRYKWADGENVKHCEATFEKVASRLYKGSVYEARKRARSKCGENVSEWLTPANLKATRPDWCVKNKIVCRGDSVVHNVAGSMSLADYKKRTEEATGKAASYVDVLKRSKVKKGTTTYISRKAAAVVESYERAMSERFGDKWKDDGVEDKDEEWTQAAGGKSHGRVYGLPGIVDPSKIQSSPSSAARSTDANYTTVPHPSESPEELNAVRSKVEELQEKEQQREIEMRELRQTVKQQIETERNRMWEESQRQVSEMFQRMSAQMELCFTQMYNQPWPFQMGNMQGGQLSGSGSGSSQQQQQSTMGNMQGAQPSDVGSGSSNPFAFRLGLGQMTPFPPFSGFGHVPFIPPLSQQPPSTMIDPLTRRPPSVCA